MCLNVLDSVAEAIVTVEGSPFSGRCKFGKSSIAVLDFELDGDDIDNEKKVSACKIKDRGVMKKVFFLVMILFFAVGCTTPLNDKFGELRFSERISEIKSEIKQMYNADSVVLYTKERRVTFSKEYSLVVLIYNAKTRTLDFKGLPMEYRQKFDNKKQIENSLRDEALPVVMDLIRRCGSYELDNLVVEYRKADEEGRPLYRFICCYDDLLGK